MSNVVSLPFAIFPVQIHEGFKPLRTDFLNWKKESCPCQKEGDHRPRWGGGFRDKRGGFDHAAVDIMAAEGTPIYAPQDGTIPESLPLRLDGVTRSRPGIGIGDKAGTYFVFWSEDLHWQYYGSHLTEAVVKPGDKLKTGDLIGYVGATGNATSKNGTGCPHLHLAVTARTIASKRFARQQKWDMMTDGKIDPVPALRPLYNAGGWQRPPEK
jgi:murein DD-endopeptidase MepM/ murein hydrolase activator NlpD